MLDSLSFTAMHDNDGIGLLPAALDPEPAPAAVVEEDIALLLADARAQLRDLLRENDRLRRSHERLTRRMAETERRNSESSHLAHHDAVTGLPNRLMLTRHMERVITGAAQRQVQLALLFIDLDGFKSVNDRHGHGTGDALMKVVSSRISSCIRSQDFACRYGGNEFVVVLSDIRDTTVVARVVEEIRLRVDGDYWIEHHPLHITASVGIARYPDDGSDCESLLISADAAMCRAKSERVTERLSDDRTNASPHDANTLRDAIGKPGSTG